MRFMLMNTESDGEPDAKLMAEMSQFIEETTRSGVLLATGGLDPRGKVIKSSGGKITVTDGPYAESKETVVGFALVEVKSEEEAIELSKRFYRIVGDGAGVIQRVFGPDDAPPGTM